MPVNDVGEVVEKIAGAIFLLVVLSIVIGSIYPAGVGILGQPQSATVNTVNETGGFVDVGGDMQYTDGIVATATTETALYFNENDSVKASGPTGMVNSSWSVCTAPSLGNASNAPINLTYDVWAYDNESIVIQFDHGDWIAYYDNGTHDALARVNATSPREGFSAICARYNDTSDKVTLTRDTDVWDTDELDNTTNPRNLSTGWVGTIDEVRTFGDPIPNTTIAAYSNDKIAPLEGNNRTSRLLFDEDHGDTTHVYFDSSSATVQGAEWTTGIAAPGIQRDVDYQFERNPLQVKLISDGYMSGAPVVFVATKGDQWWAAFQTLTSFGSTALKILSLLLIIVGASFALDQLLSNQGGGR